MIMSANPCLHLSRESRYLFASIGNNKPAAIGAAILKSLSPIAVDAENIAYPVNDAA